jgi:hypothetical protein
MHKTGDRGYLLLRWVPRWMASAVLLAVALGAASCGGARAKSELASSAPHESRGPSDRDGDSLHHGYYDPDDMPLVNYGHPASTVDRQEVEGLVARYYADAMAGKGRDGCSLLYSLFAESVVENHGEGPDTHDEGNTCTAVLSDVYKRNRKQIKTEGPKLRVVSVRVAGVRGYTLLDGGLGYQSFMDLRKESGRWKLESVLASELG